LRLLVAFPPAERVISNGLSFESFTAQTPSNSLAASAAKAVMASANPAASMTAAMLLILFMSFLLIMSCGPLPNLLKLTLFVYAARPALVASGTSTSRPFFTS
jgi:hypothetical protein